MAKADPSRKSAPAIFHYKNKFLWENQALALLEYLIVFFQRSSLNHRGGYIIIVSHHKTNQNCQFITCPALTFSLLTELYVSPHHPSVHCSATWLTTERSGCQDDSDINGAMALAYPHLMAQRPVLVNTVKRVLNPWGRPP